MFAAGAGEVHLVEDSVHALVDKVRPPRPATPTREAWTC
jgi:hypothetical protein